MKSIFSLLTVFIGAGSLSAQSNGTQLFDESMVHRIDLNFQQVGFWDSLNENYNSGFNGGGDVPYMMASVVIDGTEVDSVGVRQKGFYSNWGAGEALKKPLKISLNEYVDNKKYDGIRKINLSNGFQDPTLMRDALAYRFMRDAGIHAPRTSYSKVYLNGTYWGLYIIVEEVDKRALKNWYPADSGNLFKCISNTSLLYQGNSVGNYADEFDLKTNETQNDWSKLVYLTKMINTSQATFQDSIVKALNLDSYIPVLAADILMYNWDSYYDHGRNFFLYEHPETHKMDWIPWDYNLAFSTSETNLIFDYAMAQQDQPLVKKLQADPELRSAYFDHVCILIDNYFTLANLENYINTTAALIRPALNDDPNKFYTITNFDQAIVNDVQVQDDWGQWQWIPGLKSFIQNRQTSAHQQLSSYSHNCTALNTDELDAGEMRAYPNPFSSSFLIEASSKVEYYSVLSISGQELQQSSPKATSFQVAMDDYAPGIYFIHLKTAAGEKTLQLVKSE